MMLGIDSHSLFITARSQLPTSHQDLTINQLDPQAEPAILYSRFANTESDDIMILKPQDIVVLLKLVAVNQREWSYSQLAIELGMSPSEVHAALKRALAARLALQQANRIIPYVRNLEEFIVHGLRYVFIPERGELTRGMPTSVAAPPLENSFVGSGEPPLVWPDPEGGVRGMSISPLYRSAPSAARADKELYELLVLVDAIRAGSAREQNMAVKELKRRLKNYG